MSTEPALLNYGYEGNLQELVRGNLKLLSTQGYCMGEKEQLFLSPLKGE